MSQIQVDSIFNKDGDGAPSFPKGTVVTGVVTATSFSGNGANLTGVTATDVGTLGNLNVTGIGTFGGNVTIGGTLTYEDVTNIDSVGIITARDDIKIVTDNKKLKIGAGADLEIWHTGSESVIRNTTSGHLYIQNSGGNIDLQAEDNIFLKNWDGQTYARFMEDGASELYYDDSKKFATTSGGVKVTGGYTENIVAVSGTAVDCATGSYFTKTISGATTFTFTNVPTGVAYAFTFEVTLNGSNAITWPSSVKWPADTAPTITDGKTQVFVFLTDDGGTRWRGSSLVDYTN